MTITDEILRHVAGEPLERQRKFKNARDVYEATMPTPLVDIHIDPASGIAISTPNVLDSIVVPAAGNIVDSHVSALFGDDLTFDVTEAYGEDAQAYLERLWGQNAMPTRLIELGMHGSMTGAFGFKFEPDPEHVEDGEHRWVVFDPCYLDVAWDPHDVSRILLYRFEYPTIAEEDGKTVPFVWRQDIRAVESDPDQWGRKRIVSWTITNHRAKAPIENVQPGQSWFTPPAGSSWDQVGEPHEWPHRWAPVFAGPNLPAPNSWWGYSDIEDGVIRLIESLNRSLSNIAKTVRHFAHPTTITIGAEMPETATVGTPVDFPHGSPQEISVSNLEMQSDLAAALELYRELTGEVYQAGNVPDVARGKLDNVGQLSGNAMQIMYGPQLGVLKKKRRTYGDQIVAALRAALDYAEFRPLDGKPWAPIAIVWPNALPVNEKEQAEVGEIDQRLGASKATVLKKRGYEPEQEAENRLEEGRDDPAMRGMLDLVDGGVDPLEPAAPAEGGEPPRAPSADE